MKEKIKSLVVGAGISGLLLARDLQSTGMYDIIVAEKSRGLGGRLATRRDGELKFDHGVQFFELNNNCECIFEEWLKVGLLSKIVLNGETLYYCPQGMTSLAKFLANTLQVQTNRKVSKIKKKGSVWEVSFFEDETDTFDSIFITAPIPQALELLEKSDISFEKSLLDSTYLKQIVALVEFESSPVLSNSQFDIEVVAQDLEQIIDQGAKFKLGKHAYAIQFRHEPSEDFFELSELVLERYVRKTLEHQFGLVPIRSLQIKKWRYATPKFGLKKQFSIVSEFPYLALLGDGFGGPSVSGAVLSAKALFSFLTKGS